MHVKLELILLSRSEELRKEARQLKKELLAIKQRKEESSKPAVDEEKEGMEAHFTPPPRTSPSVRCAFLVSIIMSQGLLAER